MLYIAGSSRSLITEAIRGEGAYLVDVNGHRFMFDYDERGELAPRDVVSQSIVTQMERTRHPNVYLDMSHLPAQQIRDRFPGIDRTCREFQMDITRDRIPVRPGAHYMIGGVTVDRDGRTTLPGLWAAGEVTSSGLHGANRLASNSLLEGLVFGAHAGRNASSAAAAMPDDYHAPAIEHEVSGRGGRIAGFGRYPQLPDQPDVAGGGRPTRRADAAAGGRDDRQLVPLRLAARVSGSHAVGNCRTCCLVAHLVVRAALRREESRGVHLRTDFPETDNRAMAAAPGLAAEKRF